MLLYRGAASSMSDCITPMEGLQFSIQIRLLNFSGQNGQVDNLLPVHDKVAEKKGSPFRGMTEKQAKLAWGEPDEINRTESPSGESQQWVYTGDSLTHSRHLYFANGLLDAIQ